MKIKMIVNFRYQKKTSRFVFNKYIIYKDNIRFHLCLRSYTSKKIKNCKYENLMRNFNIVRQLNIKLIKLLIKKILIKLISIT